MKHPSNPDLSLACPACHSPRIFARKYESPRFRCTCGHEFELPAQRVNRSGFSECPLCKAEGKLEFAMTYSASRRIERLRAQFGDQFLLDDLGEGIRGRLGLSPRTGSKCG